VPELPEVETIVRDLAPKVAGRRLRDPVLYKTDVLRGVTRARLVRALEGARVLDLTRRAKHVVARLEGGQRLVIQPRMTGSLMIERPPLSRDQRRYAVLTVALGPEELLVFRDVRRLGTIQLLDERAWAVYTSRIGDEPLDPAFTLARFQAALQGSRQAVKKVLMDQRKLAGVGNIYANEALFRAGVDPSRPAHRVDPRSSARLYHAVRAVLRDAVTARGTTVRDYRTGTGGAGEFQFSLEVYGRGGEPCVRCGTTLATTHAIDGRATTFCWRCQGAKPSGPGTHGQ
jgi:formamidopyrimidine-DNA glycosylase